MTARMKKTTLIIIKVTLLIPTLKNGGLEVIDPLSNYSSGKALVVSVLKCYGDFNSFRKKGSLLMEIFKKQKEPK